MKQRLLLVLLALFTSIGWMKATVTLTVPKGATGSLSVTSATGEGNTPVTVMFNNETVKSYTVDNYAKDKALTVTIDGSLTKLTVNTKVTSVELQNAFQLEELVFSSTAGSNISTFEFEGTNALKKLTADKCGLTKLPTGYQDNIAEKAVLSFKDNKINNVQGMDLTKEYSINLSGNNITVWPDDLKDAKATITYGDQGEFTGEDATQANAWYDIYGKVNSKLGGYSPSDWSFSWKKKEASGTTTTINLEKNTANPGQYRFYDTTNKKYVDGTFQATATLSKIGLTYTVNVEVRKAKVALKKETSGEGNFTIKEATANGTEISGEIEEGTRLYLSAKPATGWAFDKYELEGLIKTNDENIYEVKILRNGQYDKLSAKAIFTKNNHKITLEANSEHGNIEIKDQNNKDITNGASVAYGSTLTIKATPEEGYKARVIVNGSELTATPTNANVFTTSITKDTKIQIFFDAKTTYRLNVEVLGLYPQVKLNGVAYSWNGGSGDAKNYYQNESNTFPYFAAGTLVTLEMVADPGAAAITKVLLNSKQIGTTNKVQFEMPANNATITFETAQLSEIEIKADVNDNKQTYAYDGSAHPFVFKTVPSGLEASFKVTYSVEDLGNYVSTVPTAPGTYDVKLTRAADALYKKIENTTYKIVISKASPVVKTVPTVTVNNTTKEYNITGGSVQVAGQNVEGTWKVIKAGDSNVKDNKYQGTESHLVTIEFTPKNENYYNVVTANTQAKVGDKSLEQYTISYDLPEGMTLKMTNGGEELTNGAKVYKGTEVKFELTYPKGYSGVSLIKNEEHPTPVGNASENGNTITYNVTISSNLALKVNYSGGISKKDINLSIIKSEMTEVTYNGEVHNLTDSNFDFVTPSSSEENDIKAIKAKMVITYKLNGKQVTSPVDAGEYTVHVSIPAVVGATTTYNALEKDFEKGLIIKKADISSTITWPKDAVVGVGKTAKTAQFIGGFAGVEGTFHFIEEDKIGVPETGDEYVVKFVPTNTNYKEVLGTSTSGEGLVKIVVTDQRSLFISDVANGSIKVTDQNGNELKNGQTLNSGITSIKVTATPNNGYVLGTLTVNNSSLSNGGSYTLGSDNVVVSATFVKQYTITLGSAPKGVKIATKPSSNVVVAGGSYTFTLNHVSGDKPTVTGASNISVSTSGSTTTVKVTNIQANATLAIALANPTAIKITTKETLSGAGKSMGTIRVSGVNSSNECYYGDKITVTATANPGVEFAGWEGLSSTENPYEFEATNATYTIQAKYHGTLTGIESVDELKYYGGDGYIFVNCPAQGTLTIISMNGRAQKMSVSGQTRVTVPAGVYGIVLTSGSEVVRDKVVVR